MVTQSAPSRRVPIGERLWARVDASGDCWIWTGSVKPNGYGQIGGAQTPDGRRPVHYVHRLAYELLVGPIPAGMTVDHLCRVTQCVNPDHMEIVPQGVNTRRSRAPQMRAWRRGTCVSGHPRTTENTYVWRNQQHCRECRRIRERKAAVA